MEKFCLKWNDFQTTVSHFFSLLRKEEDLFDVTLVTDDDVQVSAHKLVLSASSSFFKSILQKYSHSQPLIYLSGVHSTNMAFILDYIYQGEVQIFQEQLDSFLEVAQKLKVSGLISNDNEEGTEETSNIPEYPQEELIEKDYNDIKDNITEEARVETYNPGKSKVSYTLDAQTQSDIKAKVRELLTRKDGQFFCIACGKIGKDDRNMRRHIETHIDGISYECNICAKTFRSKNSLGCHMSVFHK